MFTLKDDKPSFGEYVSPWDGFDETFVKVFNRRKVQLWNKCAYGIYESNALIIQVHHQIVETYIREVVLRIKKEQQTHQFVEFLH